MRILLCKVKHQSPQDHATGLSQQWSACSQTSPQHVRGHMNQTYINRSFNAEMACTDQVEMDDFPITPEEQRCALLKGNIAKIACLLPSPPTRLGSN